MPDAREGCDGEVRSTEAKRSPKQPDRRKERNRFISKKVNVKQVGAQNFAPLPFKERRARPTATKRFQKGHYRFMEKRHIDI